jgi:hypothetical protein
VTRRTDTRRSVWAAIGAAFMGLARRAGGSLRQHPMPELREVSQEWRRLDVWA